MRALIAPAGAALLATVLAGLRPAVCQSYLNHVDGGPDGQRALVWGKLRQQKQPRVIAYTGFNQPYPLYGEDLRNRVHYVAVDGRQAYNLHDYLKLLGGPSGLKERPLYKPAYYRQEPSSEEWMRGIETLGVDLLVVSRFTRWDQEEFEHDEEGFPWEESWARSRPERFRLSFSTPDLRVYEVVPAPRNESPGTVASASARNDREAPEGALLTAGARDLTR